MGGNVLQNAPGMPQPSGFVPTPGSGMVPINSGMPQQPFLNMPPGGSGMDMPGPGRCC